MIKAVAFTAYAVADVPRAVAFYRDVLGLEPGEAFNDGYVEFNVGPSTFAVDGDPPGYEPGTCSGVAFEVDDVAVMRARLVASGAQASDVVDFPTCRVCFARDPDGNGFTLHEKR
jgi:catechol 2,3-dioxygenase-like lactoylglutathione lyase family enzyme